MVDPNDLETGDLFVEPEDPSTSQEAEQGDFDTEPLVDPTNERQYCLF